MTSFTVHSVTIVSANVGKMAKKVRRWNRKMDLFQRRRQDFESEGAKGRPGKKVRGHHKTKKYAKLRHFSFHGLFCIFQKLEYFWNGTDTTCISKFWTYFYHNYFTGLLVLPNNFGKFSVFWCKNILKYNLHLLRNVCFYKRHMFTRWERKRSYMYLLNSGAKFWVNFC